MMSGPAELVLVAFQALAIVWMFFVQNFVHEVNEVLDGASVVAHRVPPVASLIALSRAGTLSILRAMAAH
jgi:hypothetical protein